ncbi:hypothetical protein RHABOEDO_001262 [Candidatus Rhabdochlamydia oedothoracis]|uniref:Tetratricopeptide repeat protein n=1 Tax=Candidatus Rhabdochlamydia oedothoracis TaxID=2720720 RepID=A0ABX8V1F8_9BACT|nr:MULTISPECIES: hypothetical protein [Rhabdochlamydia]KAG6558897.1 hypothetical protein RHOW815_001107 [Candidatus Rhabdochlamydia sp. W815]MCL6755679.1 hypothetical protein [Candidatus Rhabdochlamydia oedothoracis]QYF49011.1 hypothetical protein RHABOEDO_001262 [Candidatus Rhabdochlamydia oedothoracis]
MKSPTLLEISSIYFPHRFYRITFSPSLSNLKLDASKKTFFQKIHSQIQENPEKYLSALEAFYKDHLDIPEVANLLAFAYLRLKKSKQAEELIKITYDLHPSYLCAKINYADQCLRYKKIQEIPAIFHHKRDLLELYPDRFCFHYSEFRGFMVCMGFYHLACKNRDYADKHRSVAEEVDPLHPGVIALKNALKKRFWNFFYRR